MYDNLKRRDIKTNMEFREIAEFSASTSEKRSVEVAGKNVDIDAIYPALEDKDILRLKNEFAFAQYKMELSEQRVMFTAMSRFDTRPFLEDPDVHAALYDPETHKYDYSGMTPQVLNRYYWSTELRSIVLPIRELLPDNTRNYQSGLLCAVRDLQTRILRIDNKVGSNYIRTTISPIEAIRILDNHEMLITFSQSFMPYLLALSGYKQIDLHMLTSLKNMYATRYFHWFIYSLGNKSRSRFTLTVNELRERLALTPNSHQRHFMQRIIQEPVTEINKRTNLNISLKEIRSKKRGRPLEAVEFTITKKKQKKKQQPDLFQS